MSDFLVVGGGSAGIVLTRRLLDAGKTVTLVEAGLRDPNPDIDHLYNLGKLWHSEQDWDYYTVPQKGAHGRRLHLPRARSWAVPTRSTPASGYAVTPLITMPGKRWATPVGVGLMCCPSLRKLRILTAALQPPVAGMVS